uniref:Fic family protein n=1 Tax=Ningiella ruwaisensis TaxID=2364274 RepID=UPI00109F0644|nr:Fic family protein [Ningiella ruwaisensis]
MNIKKPPEVIENVFSKIASEAFENMDAYLDFFSPTDKKGRYLPYDELRHRIDDGLNHSYVWSLTKAARNRQQCKLFTLGEPSQRCSFVLTPLIQKAISEVDRNTTSASLEWISSQIGEKSQVDYLLNDLIEDESISSSQLEGAATTTQVAKDMLKKGRKPRSEDEKMILGNYKLMLFAWENRNQALSVELISDMHRIGVEGIDDDNYTPGIFRKSDDVHVVDADGNIVHTPPNAKNLKSRLKKTLEWFNKKQEDSDDSSYLHPLIKAIALHFVIGYEHPFRDGNGRVARALFYWYMFKRDFAAFRYIAISVLLKKAPIKYGKSYLYTETDSMDFTYFFEYQCSTIIRAIKKFKESYKNTALEIEKFNQWLWDAGLFKQLSEKQRTVFQVAKNGIATGFTIRNVESNLACSYNTAASTLNGLVDLKLFKKVKNGREWLYFMDSKESIMENWGK